MAALRGLNQRDDEELQIAISLLRIELLNSSTPPTAREAIHQQLAAFVREHAPAMPHASGTFDYCLAPSETRYPTVVELALQTIGNRLGADKMLPLDLTDVNLAYAHLQDLDLSNARLDGALLCRAILKGTTLKHATLRGADLRHAVMLGSNGLTAEQLMSTGSIFDADLPEDLGAVPSLVERIQVTPPGDYQSR